jgi:hypothetical protein
MTDDAKKTQSSFRIKSDEERERRAAKHQLSLDQINDPQFLTKMEECRHILAESIARRFINQLLAILSDHGVCIPTKKMLSIYQQFYQDIAEQFATDSDNMGRLFDVYSGFQHLFSQPAEEDKPASVKMIMDAFGRGLLYPIEQAGALKDADERIEDEFIFPRPLCGPLLATVKNYLIGPEKYDITNQRFLASIIKYCQTDSNFTKDDLDTYFMNEKVLKYLLGYILFLLSAVRTAPKREAVFQQFRKNVAGMNRAKALGLSDEELRTTLEFVFTTWARFTHAHLNEPGEFSKARLILAAYLPDLEDQSETD